MPSPAEDATEAADSVEARARRHPRTYLEFAIAGGPVMIPIGLCSLFWVAFLVERLISTRRSRVVPRGLVQSLKGLVRTRPPSGESVQSALEGHPSSAATVLRAAWERLRLPRQEMEMAVQSIAQREIRTLRRNLRLFAIIASVAPLLGLLGTVTGMIQSFREVAIHGLGAGEHLAPGIYEALITTAGGLLVAIPALLTYYWFMGRVDGYVHQIDGLVVDLVEAHHTGGGA